MSIKVSVYIATSLDGFIARTNGEVDWLDQASENVPEGEDHGFAEFMSSVDTLVMGRNTYEKVLSFGQWPYGETPVIVLSRNPIEFPRSLPETLSHSSDAPQALCDKLADQGRAHVYLDGGNTIQRFLSAGLVDEITVSIIPLIIGSGIPLFGPTAADISLHCLSSKAFDSGIVQVKYAVNR